MSGNLIRRQLDELLFDLKQGWTVRTIVHNQLWLLRHR